MMTFLLMLAAAPATAAPAMPRKCEYQVERVSTRSGAANYNATKDASMHLRAVETSVNGCPVLTEAGTGRMIEPPVFDGKDAKLAPAR